MDATIGCAVSVPGKTGADELLRNADLAMYAGKRKGKGCFVTYEPSMYQALADRLELEADLRGALDRGEISVDYQPIVEVGTGRLTAVEALARWNHPQRGAVTPAVFIPLAEEIGVIRALGRFVLATACTQASRWAAERPNEPVGITVNVSPAQFQHGELAADVRRALDHAGLAPELLTLEITESVLVERELRSSTSSRSSPRSASASPSTISAPATRHFRRSPASRSTSSRSTARSWSTWRTTTTGRRWCARSSSWDGHSGSSPSRKASKGRARFRR